MNSPAPTTVVINTNYGAITVALQADEAPVTVTNFLHYVDSGFYGETIFHRVIDGFMIQGGGISTEFVAKATSAPIALESNNGLSNIRGTIAMARTAIADSATSQFFINTVDNPGLNYQSSSNPGYAVFGTVIQGMDVVDSIENSHTFSVKTSSNTTYANLPFPLLIEILDTKQIIQSETTEATTPTSSRIENGVEVVVFAGKRAEYDVKRNADSSLSVNQLDGAHHAEIAGGATRLIFSDMQSAYDIDGAAGDTARLINAAFGFSALKPDLNGIGLRLFDQGETLESVADLALQSTLWQSIARGSDHATFVRTVYFNIVGSLPDAQSQTYYQGMLDRNETTQAKLLALAAESEVNGRFIDLVGLSHIGLEFI